MKKQKMEAIFTGVEKQESYLTAPPPPTKTARDLAANGNDNEGPVQNVQMERLIGVLADQVRVCCLKVQSEVLGRQNIESMFCEWTMKIADYLIVIEPQLEVMLDWALAGRA